MAAERAPHGGKGARLGGRVSSPRRQGERRAVAVIAPRGGQERRAAAGIAPCSGREHSHKVPGSTGSRNGVEGQGSSLYKIVVRREYTSMERQIIMWSATLIHSGQYLRVDASLKRQKIYICATNEETNLHKYIRNVEKSTFRPYYMYSSELQQQVIFKQ